MGGAAIRECICAGPLAIIGFGQEGRALLNLLVTHCPDVSVAVLNEGRIEPSVKERYRNNGRVAFFDEVDCLKRLPEYAQAFRSPGVSIYREELQDAIKRGVRISSSAQLWHDLHTRDFKIIVTGTKGKSTTSALLSCVLAGCGEDAILAGNIGIPLADFVVSGRSHRYWIVEMSSYQLSDFSGDPEIAVLTNLYPEHIDWHRGIDNYFRDKTRIFSGLKKGRAVLNRRDGNTGKWIENSSGAVYFNDPDGFSVTEQGISYQNRHVISRDGLAIKGDHNLGNVCAALSVTNLLGIPWEEAIRHMGRFRGLPHRMEVVAEKDGVTYVDDSIATIPEATMNAIKVFLPRPITLLVGGYDRGLDWKAFAGWLARSVVHAVIGLPETGWAIVDHMWAAKAPAEGGVSGIRAEGMEEAMSWSRRITPRDGVVLLSPAAPSYNRYQDYQARGRHFRSQIRQ
uniref:UDP-N-acetylmuramoylalanine--D-glutamate ligase n=1 Tax=Candidatus Kentrum sp. DK TaxID=2126562 RepID=A0A450RUK9_9GAMM|nr:MAG: UDP-N-acetylmuramoylalanine--D-glutamate ligase [Candidatus Kentron sp. DK]